MRAIIDWISKEQGGRDKPPAGVGFPPYSPTVRFTDTDEPWPPPILWSFAISKIRELDHPSQWLADARFRVEEAPHDTLRSGRTFELYEGARCVARGRFVDDTILMEGDKDAANLPAPGEFLDTVSPVRG